VDAVDTYAVPIRVQHSCYDWEPVHDGWIASVESKGCRKVVQYSKIHLLVVFNAWIGSICAGIDSISASREVPVLTELIE